MPSSQRLQSNKGIALRLINGVGIVCWLLTIHIPPSFIRYPCRRHADAVRGHLLSSSLRSSEKMFSILILTKNEQGNIRDCMQSVAWCDDVVVLDSLSDDATCEIPPLP